MIIKKGKIIEWNQFLVYINGRVGIGTSYVRTRSHIYTVTTAVCLYYIPA